MASAAPFVAVMDADLQHDETLLPAMLRALREDRADLLSAAVTGARGARKADCRLSAGLEAASPTAWLGWRCAPRSPTR